MVVANDTLYSKAVMVTEEYLGPAGERFIRRHITTHLKIEPEALDKNSLRSLINWLSITFALLTNDAKNVASFTRDLKLLTVNGK